MTTRTIRNEAGRQHILRFIQSLSLEYDRAWDISIERHKKKRTLSQNAYLHLILGIIAKETGNTLDDIKGAYKYMFHGMKQIEFAGEEHLVPYSTRDFDSIETATFIDQIIAHAQTELGIILPDPSEAQLND